MKIKKPLFSLVEDRIRSNIEKKVYKEGDLIPTEKDLARKYKYSQGTIRKAILNLVQEKRLKRIPGKGTIVLSQDYNRIKYFRFIESIGSELCAFNLSILGVDVVLANNDLSNYLQLRKGSKVIRLERMGKIKRDLLIYTESFLPKRYYNGLESYPKDEFIKHTLWKLQDSVFKIKVKEVREYLSIITANAHFSQLLEVPEGAPLLCIEMIVISKENKVVEYRISHCNQGQLKFKNSGYLP